MSFEMTFEGANRWRLPDTEWDGIPNCWSCKTECFTTNGRGGERNMISHGRLEQYR